MGYADQLTGHGMRATISTALNEIGYPKVWVDAQLSHADPDKVSAAYNHAEYVEQRRTMMQDWANRLDLWGQSKHRLEMSTMPGRFIAPLINGEKPLQVASQIGDACEKVGFFYIKNHGIDQQLIDEMYTFTKRFFKLPYEEKNKLNIVNSGLTLRGYIPMYAENVDPESPRVF